jgi:hypothetical protein
MEITIAMLLARAWLMQNSSSRRGRIGEKMVLPVKLKNHRSHRKERKRRALPDRASNRSIAHSTFKRPANAM